MDKIWVIVIWLVLIFMPSYSAYRIGRNLERKSLTQYLGTALEDECIECRDIGYRKGIRTCDDMVQEINSEGRR